MAETEGLSRKKKVRAAHRASVTRMIAQIREMLSAEGEADPPKLNHKKLSLAAKAELLGKLDEEIVDLVHEDELEEEVEVTDTIRERIELTIIELDSAIRRSAETPRDHGAVRPELSDGDRTPELTHNLQGPGMQEHGGGIEQRADPLRRVRSDSGAPPPPAPSDQLLAAREATTASQLQASTRTDASQPMGSENPLVFHSTRAILPKLSLKRFNGDPTRWVTFWDTFESAVHNNTALTDIDKFSYLTSLLEATASEAVAGLTLTSVNYGEAVAILKRRFGNKQQIISRHMELLLRLESVTSQHNLKGLRQLFDVVESNVRGLRALGVSSSSYGGLLSSILMSRLPAELRLIISRELGEEEWDFGSMLEILRREMEARERSAGVTPPQTRKPLTKPPPTALSLTTGAASQANCAYCGQPHFSGSCPTVRDPGERKQALRTAGRCFICLKRNHISRNCRSSARCHKCSGRHHTSICLSSGTSDSSAAKSGPPLVGSPSPASTGTLPVQTTASMCVNSHTPILLQTAKAVMCDVGQPEPSPTLEVRVIFDAGSQRSYVTTRVREALGAERLYSECMIIKAFGSERGEQRVCDVVQLKIATIDGEPLVLTLVVVPHICDAVQAQPINSSKATYQHLFGLELADSGDVGGDKGIDLLIGSDHYWQLVTGRIVKGSEGPTAVETKLGWVLSGPAEGLPEEVTVNFASVHSSHVLRVGSATEPETMEAELKRFWDLESLGILKEEQSTHKQFSQRITFKQGRYEVCLPWKESHPPLSDNYDLCRRRLTGLLKRLRRNPKQLRQYDSVIQEQLSQGVVEVVTDPSHYKGGRLHYLPHHGISRQDKQTTKLRVVYDASARTNGTSLNDCLYAGPNFGQSILDTLLRFRLHRVAFSGDLEKAFLTVSVAECDRDVLRFLWVADASQPTSDIVILRFTRVVFGVTASPFLLNATVDHHMARLISTDESFVEKFRRSIYVDDILTSFTDVESAYNFYIKARRHLAEASFNLRKLETSSSELRQLISSNEQKLCQDGGVRPPDGSSSLSEEPEQESVMRQVLGVEWDTGTDQLVFDPSSTAQLMRQPCLTKRDAVSLATRFYDPLGVLSPITVRFKLLFQQLCEKGLDWDEPLTEELRAEWDSLTTDLQQSEPFKMPRCCTESGTSPVTSYSLNGYCDASEKAYAAVVYLRADDDDSTPDQFLCSKTRVAPVKRVTVPRLELLSALLLARLISTIRRALEPEITLSGVTCHTDSQVALFWIRGLHREWKQFVQNRVTEIRGLVPVTSWRHCPGVRNPADIPSRGTSSLELQRRLGFWLHGPPRQPSLEDQPELGEAETVPEECLVEMRTGERKGTTVNLLTPTTPTAVLPVRKYGSLRKLLRVTAYILKFANVLNHHKTGLPNQADKIPSIGEFGAALNYWLKVSQSSMPSMKNFQSWTKQFGLFRDDSGIWRCGGRLGNAVMPYGMRYPILLNKEHHLTLLIVRECHERVAHGGVKATLTELRSNYWLVQGRRFIEGILRNCVVCRRFQGGPYSSPPAPPLPPFRVNEARPFSHVGVDFAGPLYVRDTVASPARKVWICLFTCAVVRAVHLDVVPDMTTQGFIRCFKRFASRRGFPTRVVSDNAKTFKAAARRLEASVNPLIIGNYLSDVGVKWSFNLEKAPWWGGLFERMVQTVKRCLRKTIGGARLTYDELLTSITEVEMTLNSRPLTYLSSEDLDEPLTPSHLVCGYRVLSLPDPTASEDAESDNVSVSSSDLTRRMRHLGKTLDEFWRRWKKEYLLELREAHRHCRVPQGTNHPIAIGDVVIVHDENLPRGLWKLGRVQRLIAGMDGHVRGAVVRVGPKGRCSTLNRPVQRLYPLEFGGHDAQGPTATPPVSGESSLIPPDGESTTESSLIPPDGESTTESSLIPPDGESTTESSRRPTREKERPRRRAFLQARDVVKTWCSDLLQD